MASRSAATWKLLSYQHIRREKRRQRRRSTLSRRLRAAVLPGNALVRGQFATQRRSSGDHHSPSRPPPSGVRHIDQLAPQAGSERWVSNVSVCLTPEGAQRPSQVLHGPMYETHNASTALPVHIDRYARHSGLRHPHRSSGVRIRRVTAGWPTSLDHLPLRPRVQQPSRRSDARGAAPSRAARTSSVPPRRRPGHRHRPPRAG